VSPVHHWEEVSPYLDRALELDEGERTAWIASVREQNPTMGTLLKSMLTEHRRLMQENFLEDAAPIHPSAADHLGERIGAYTVTSKIGQGGMGSVWRAERIDGRFERQVAVKFLNMALLEAGEERFKQEGRLLGVLAHPNIAELIDAGVSATGQPYLVLEYVDGKYIDQYCDEHKLDIRSRVRLFLDVLAAVGRAHGNLIVHRDIKPSNVLVSHEGRVKLLDFGIAKLLEEGGEANLAAGITAVKDGRPMTPEYAAPEQLKGDAITTATDIYGLGVLLYLLLTGEHPAGSEPSSYADLVKAVVDTEPDAPSDKVLPRRVPLSALVENAAVRGTTPDGLRRGLRGDLDTIILKALKKDPTERFQSASAFADDLCRYLRHEPISAQPDNTLYRTRKFVRRNRTAVGLGSLAAVCAVTGLAATLIQARRATSERDFALRQVGRAAVLDEFHHFLLSDGVPGTLTVNNLLRHAESIVAKQQAPNDVLRIELMIAIGRQYLEQDEDASSRRLLEDAYRLTRGVSDRAVRAEAACALSSSLARDEELSRAEALFQEGLREVPEGTQFALTRMTCLQSGSEVAQEQNQVWKELERAEAALRVLRNSPFDSDVFEMHCWVDLAKAYRSAGKTEQAAAAFAKADALLSSLGRSETVTAAVLFNDWGLQLYQKGRALEAEPLFRRSMKIGQAQQSEQVSDPFALNNYARCLRGLNRLSEATQYAERAYEQAVKAQNEAAISQSLLERARLYTSLHKTAQASAVLADAELRFRKILPPGHYAFASLASARSINELEKGDVAAALRFADSAVEIDETAVKRGDDGPFYLTILLVSRAEVEVRAGRADLALRDATRALGKLPSPSSPATYSSTRGHAYMALGGALRLESKAREAEDAFRTAAEDLEKAVGPNHPDTQRARALAAASAGA
jgi:serine/threonine-protein kinase